MNDIVEQYGFSEQDREPKPPFAPFNPDKLALAMAYVPDQLWETPYDVMEGMHRGTLFPALDKPFLGGGNRR